MKIITGGRYNGKKEYVTDTLGYRMEDILDMSSDDPMKIAERLDDHAVLYRLESFVYNAVKNGMDPCRPILDHIDKNPDTVIVCDETGCGIIPGDKDQERSREITGRLMCELTKRAGSLIRIYNGIAEELKI